MKILLVEDNVLDAKMLQLTLFKVFEKEFKPTLAQNVGQAVHALRHESFDAVLLDLSLPDSEGIETVTRIHEVSPDTPIIVLTGTDDETLALQTLRHGVQDYLVKGEFGGDLLRRVIRYAAERARTERDLREREAQLRDFFDAAGDLIQIVSLDDGGILQVNRAWHETLGYVPEDLSRLRVFDIIHPDSLPQYRKQTARLQAEGGQVRFETVFLARDGKEIPVEGRVNCRLEKGKPTAARGVFRDMTVWKEAETEIRRALVREQELNTFKSRFVSMLTHDLRNPLTVIQGTVEVLQYALDTVTKEELGAYLPGMANAASRMNRLIDEVMMIGKSEAGKLRFEPSEIDLALVCGDTVREIEAAMRRRVAVSQTGLDAPAWADETLVHHILANLLSNACKYSPPGTDVVFESLVKDGTARFVVRDSGIGIPAEDLPNLFTGFFRAGNVGERQGTGLGLALVKECAELHGGTVTVESAVGRGTAVTVVLPVGRAEE